MSSRSALAERGTNFLEILENIPIQSAVFMILSCSN